MHLNKFACHHAYIYPTALQLQSTDRPHITAYKVEKKEIYIYHAIALYVQQ